CWCRDSAVCRAHYSAGAVSAPFATTTLPSASSSPAGAISRTTAWRWKVQQEKECRAREEGKDIKEHRKASQFNCRHCGQPKTTFTHSRVFTKTNISAPPFSKKFLFT